VDVIVFDGDEAPGFRDGECFFPQPDLRPDRRTPPASTQGGMTRLFKR